MGLLHDLVDRWRRRRHRASMDWEIVASTLLMSHEVALAEADRERGGGRRASPGQVRDSVLDEIGGLTVFVDALAEAHYQAGWSASPQDVADEALEDSRYTAARRRLFPDLAQDPDATPGLPATDDREGTRDAGETAAGSGESAAPAADADIPVVLRQARAEDPVATRVAQRALDAWHRDREADIAEALRTSPNLLSPEQAFADAYATVRTVAASVEDGRVHRDVAGIYEDVHRIGRERVAVGTAGDWVAISWYLRQHAAVEALQHYLDDEEALRAALERWRRAREAPGDVLS